MLVKRSDLDGDETDLAPLVEPLAIRDGVLTLWGWGVSVSVRDRHLVVTDGVAADRRSLRIPKGPSRLRRLIILAESGGSVTLDALDWLRDAGAALIILDRRGEVREAFGARRIDDVRLRRAQAVAPVTGLNLEFARLVLSMKLSGQADALACLSHVDSSVAEGLREAAKSVADAASLSVAIEAETGAAGLFWAVLAPLQLEFVTRDKRRVPGHWKTVGWRQSGLGGTPRRAICPAHALWNFCYALLEAETTIALMRMGLDPGMGILHADEPNRNSFSLDVMEAVRGTVDSFVVGFLLDHVWRYTDAVELVEGDCRLAPALAYRIAREIKLRKPVEHAVSKVARLFAVGYDRKVASGHIAPALQRRDRLDSGPVVAKSPLKSAAMRITRASQNGNAATKERRCLDCGSSIGTSRAKSCPTCRPERILVQRERTFEGFRGSGPTRLAELRKSGRDPTNTPKAKAKKANKVAAQYRLNAAWVDDGSLNGIDFARDILPRIAKVPLRHMAKMLGLSQAYCSHIRSAKVVPHRRHWLTLLNAEPILGEQHAKEDKTLSRHAF